MMYSGMVAQCRRVLTTSKIPLDGTRTFQFKRTSTYVAKARRVQEVKEDDRKCRELLESGAFLMFGGKQGGEPLLSHNEKGGQRRRLVTCTYEGSLQSEYEFDPATIASESIFLDFAGNERETPRFAIRIPSTNDTEAAAFCNPRIAFFILHKDDASIVAHAASLLEWHRTFKYCPCCGRETHRNAAGTQKRCDSCNQVHYPQLSPVAITLLTNPDQDRCLLVRQPRFVKSMFTSVAGYIEPGETLEEAVRREVAEEIGLDVLTQRYLTSQHWPFPSSTLMLGSMATVDPRQNISLDGKELEAARWFDLSQVREAVRNAEMDPYLRLRNDRNVVFVPPKGAIAHDLVQHFLGLSKNS